jgi:hypothetical protein
VVHRPAIVGLAASWLAFFPLAVAFGDGLRLLLACCVILLTIGCSVLLRPHTFNSSIIFSSTELSLPHSHRYIRAGTSPNPASRLQALYVFCPASVAARRPAKSSSVAAGIDLAEPVTCITFPGELHAADGFSVMHS